MKANPFSHENSLNLTNYSVLDHAVDKNHVVSHYNLDETDISILNAINSKKTAKTSDISSTLKEIDDLLLRLRPASTNFPQKYPENRDFSQGFSRKYAENTKYAENRDFPQAFSQKKYAEIPKFAENRDFSGKLPQISAKTALFSQKRVNIWEIPISLNLSEVSAGERKVSEKEQEFDVFLMEKNLQLRQISKSFSQYLSVYEAIPAKLSLKSRVFAPIAKFLCSILANDSNSIGLFCDVRQIETFIADFIEILLQTGSILETNTAKAWILASRGLFIAKEKFSRVKQAAKLSAVFSNETNNNMSLTSNSLNLCNETEILENIESDEEFEEFT